uniref:Putative conserved secreted protein n=1 Tax=Culex tarsalis TaxID=7177 RepID=A0A1Q3F3W6_CULTA
MKLLFVVTLLTFCILQSIHGSTKVMPNARHSAFPGKCYDGQSKIKVTRGYYLYYNCKMYTCSSDFTLTIEGCPLKTVPQGCHLTRDSSLEYPDCCSKVVC